jgi:hypothetical protein
MELVSTLKQIRGRADVFNQLVRSGRAWLTVSLPQFAPVNPVLYSVHLRVKVGTILATPVHSS